MRTTANEPVEEKEEMKMSAAERGKKERKNRTVAIGHDGVREESLIVNGNITDVLSSGVGRVWVEAIVHVIDAEGYEWKGCLHIEVPLMRTEKKGAVTR